MELIDSIMSSSLILEGNEEEEYKSVCRACLSANMQVRTLKNKELINIYGKLAKTKFNKGKKKPRTICNFCYKKLQKCLAFSQMSSKAEKFLNYSSCHSVEATYKYINKVGRFRQQDLSVCENIKGETMVASHLTSSDKPIPFNEINTAQNKVIKVEPADSESSSENDNSVRGNNLENLPSSSGQVGKLKEEETRSTINLFSCNTCFMKFNRKRNIIKHMDTHKPFSCEVCGEVFEKNLHLVEHSKTHTVVETIVIKEEPEETDLRARTRTAGGTARMRTGGAIASMLTGGATARKRRGGRKRRS